MKFGAVVFTQVYSKELSKLLNKIIARIWLHDVSKVGILASILSIIGAMLNLSVVNKAICIAWSVYLVVNLIFLLFKCKSPLLISDTVFVDNFDVNSKQVFVHCDGRTTFTRFSNVVYCICKIGNPAILIAKGGIICVHGEELLSDGYKDEEA